MEINDESQVEVGQAEVGEELRFVALMEIPLGFKIYNHAPVNDNVETKVVTERHALVKNRHRTLGLETDAAQLEFVTESPLIDFLQ